MASVLILIGCLTVFVNCQDVTKPNNPLADVFDVIKNTAESFLTQNLGDVNKITRTLEDFGSHLPKALKQMLRGSGSEKKSENSKKKALAEKLRKLKAKIEAKKKAKAAAKSKAKTEADLAAQRQGEDLSSRNEFNSKAISTTDGVTSQTILAQAGENAQAEAALNLQGLNPIQLPNGAASQAIVSGVNTVVSPGRPFGTPFNSQNQFPSTSSTIGTLDINASPLVPAQPNLMQQGPIRRAALPFANSPLPQRGGFVATVTGGGTVVPDNINYGIGQFQMPRNLVRFPRSSQISYTPSLASPVLSSPSITYNSVASPVMSTSYSTPYMVNPPITTTYSMMPTYRSSVFTGVPYSSSVVMNAPFRPSVSPFNTGQNIYVTPI